MNSTATQDYTFRDVAAAMRLRETLVEKYPEVMNTENIGQIPNNALFHAETTCLLRAARANGGSLKGQTIEMHVDRHVCGSCRTILPYIASELGNPEIIITDHVGIITTIRDGRLIR